MQRAHQGKSPALWLATLASSALYAAAHPPLSMWMLALVATAPVSAVLLDPRSRVRPLRAAMAGLLFGAASTWMMVGHWSWLASQEFFAGAPLRAAGFVAVLPLLASGVAVHYAVAFALMARLAGAGAAAGVVGGAALWALAELARSSFGYGNPWGAFAAALANGDEALARFLAATPVGDLLALAGPVAVAFVAAATGVSIGLAWAGRRDAALRGRALAAGALVVVVALAAPLVARSPGLDRASDLPILRVALVQPGFGKSRLWERGGAGESFDRHLGLTRRLAPGSADLVVWPENALPFLLDANEARRDVLRAVARDTGAALLVGGSRSVHAAGRTHVFNSAFLFPADGGLPLAYDKRLLLPFIERVPAWVAPFLASRWQGAYSAGRSADGIAEELASAASPESFRIKGWRVAPLLCFEAIYPEVAAARVAAGADLLVNLSNDSWFDAGAGAEQHFSLAALVAAETRRPLVRVATTGVSALVGEDGLVVRRLPPREAGVVVLDVKPPHRESLFVRGGRVVGSLLVVVVAAGALLAAWGSRSNASGRKRG